MRNDPLRSVGIGCALLATVLTALALIRWGPLVSYDDRIARALHRHAVAHPGVTHLMRVLSDWIWDPLTMRILAAVVCAGLWWRGRRERALRVALAVVAAAVVQQGLKALVGRARPVWSDPVDSAHYAAYPSGHAMTATVVCGLLLWLLPRDGPRWTARTAWVAAAVSVAGVGVTRVYLGVHWFTDVLAGWLLGVVLLALATAGSGRRPRSVPAGR